jgi:hypothetical protein
MLSGYGPPPKILSFMAMPASSVSITPVVILRTAVCVPLGRKGRMRRDLRHPVGPVLRCRGQPAHRGEGEGRSRGLAPQNVDTKLATSVIVMAPQLVVSRKTNPQQPLVVSISAFHTAYAAAAARAVADAVDTETPRTTGAEDFAHMLRAYASAYIRVGNGPVAQLHHPKYDFNDLNAPPPAPGGSN